MDKIRNMRAFMAVAETGSFTHASKLLSMTAAATSRSVAELEAHLRSRLFNRTTRKVALTEAGRRYLKRCREILAALEDAEKEARDAHALPSGTLRLLAPPAIGEHFIVPAAAAYQREYPEVSVDLTLSPGTHNFVEEGFDVAMRLTASELPTSNLISQRIGNLGLVLCAAPQYLDTFGIPQAVEDLKSHSCLQLSSLPGYPKDRWILYGPDGEEDFQLAVPKFQVNLMSGMVTAVREGMGIGTVSMLSAQGLLTAGSLVRVLPHHTLPPMKIFALYASRQYLDAKIGTWTRFSRAWLTSRIGEGRVRSLGAAGAVESGREYKSGSDEGSTATAAVAL